MSGVKKTLAYFDQWMDPAGPEWVSRHSHIDLVRMDQNGPEDAIWSALAGAHGHQCRPSTETQKKYFPGPEFLDRCPNLLAVASAGAGYDMVDVAACTERGILVCNQSGANAESVAQHALGLMLLLSKRMIQADHAMRSNDRNWTRWNFCGDELTEKTVGIIGLGNIGRRLAEFCRTMFRIRVMAYDPYLSEAEINARGAEQCSDLNTLFEEADFISINCPLTAETRHFVGAEQFGRMKKTAYFINTARGGIHDEAALDAALRADEIAGAGLDVYEVEPPPVDHPLLRHENVISTPHNAGITHDCNFNMATWSADQWGLVLAGKRPPRLINPDAWDLFQKRYTEMFGD